jgi:pimeloyl-ACP methyl ester carboxylesterase
MGGAVAQALALTFPERVTRLCLVNSVAFDRWPARAARFARMACAIPALGRSLGTPLLAGLVHGSLLTGFADVEAGRHALDHYLHAFTTRLGVDTLVAQLRSMHDRTVEPLGRRLGELRLPTAVIWGRGDPFLPVTLGERIRAAIPGASLDVIESARHFTPEDAPDGVASVIRALLSRPV